MHFDQPWREETHPMRFHPPEGHTFPRLLPAVFALPVPPTAAVLPASTTPAAADTSQFKGVNWARPGDNYVDGPVVPEGLDVADSYATVKAKADVILSGFQNTLGANTIRLPINTKSVGTTWWNAYTGAIDAATAKGFKVILSYWEDGASSNGAVVDTAAYNSMWN